MAFQGFLKQSTAVDVLIGPFVDDTDGVTPEAGLTIAQADVLLSKNGQTLAQKSDVTACVADGTEGDYNCELDATDTNTVGQLTIRVSPTGALPIRLDYHVVEEAVYDAMYGGSAAGPLQSTTPGTTLDVSATGEAGIDWANIGSPTTPQNLSATNIDVDQVVASVSGSVGSLVGHTVQTGDTFALANGATGFAAIDTVVDAIKVKTDFLPSATAGAAGGVFIAGTNAATTVTTSFTTTFTGNLTGSVGSVTGAVGSVAGNVDGNVTGSVGSVTNLTVTAGTTLGAGTHTAQTGDNFALLGTVSDLGGGATVGANLSDMAGATFSTTTDTLEAIRDRGDAAWTTGAGGSDRLLMNDTTIAAYTSNTSFTLTAGSTSNDAYNNCTVVIEGNADSTIKSMGIISDYVGATKTVTLKYDPNPAVTFANTDKIYILAESSLKSTAANRQLDVTATGAAGIDWANIENPTTAVDLSGTDIQLCDTVTTSTNLTNLPTIPTNWLTADGLAADAGTEIGTAVWASSTRGLTATGLDLVLKSSTFALAMADAVWDEVLTGATHNVATSAGRRLRGVQDNQAYDDGAIWVDTVNGTAGTTVYENGTAGIPVSTLADALTLAAAANVKHLHIVNGSTITLTSTMDNYEITGDEWGIELETQSCDGLSVHNAHLNGVGVSGTFSGNPHLLHSTLGAVTGPNARVGWCALTGAVTSNGTGTWVIHSCWGLSGAQFDFGAGAGQTIYITDWIGGPITIAGMAAGDVLYFEGRSAALTLAASCTGGTVYFAGDIALTNSGSGQTINQSSRYEITRILSDSTAFAGASIADIVADTNELQTDDVPTLIAAVQTVVDKVPLSDGVLSWNATALAAINAEADTALTDYDAPTNTEMLAAFSTTDGLIGTAQADLDIITGADGVNLLTATQASIDAIEADTGTDGVKLNATQPTGWAANLVASAGQIKIATVDTVTNTHTPTTTEFQADDVTEATADHYNGRIVIFTSGALAGQATSISDYAAVGGIGQFTVVAMTEAPANNDTFIII